MRSEHFNELLRIFHFRYVEISVFGYDTLNTDFDVMSFLRRPQDVVVK